MEGRENASKFLENVLEASAMQIFAGGNNRKCKYEK